MGKCDPEGKDKTTFGRAAKINNYHAIQLLVEHKGNPSVYDDDALKWASRCGYIESTQCLIENIGSFSQKSGHIALCWAVSAGHTNVVQCLLDGKCQPDSGDAVVSIAAQYGHIRIVKMLLANGFGFGFKDNAAIRYSAKNGHIDIVKLLLEHKCDPTAADNDALKWAAKGGNLELVRLLIKNKCDPYAEEKRSMFLALTGGHMKIFSYMVEATPTPVKIMRKKRRNLKLLTLLAEKFETYTGVVLDIALQ
jgi:ankyrin repeat protein